ncbi:hypothetical protein Ancab_035374 [Ancistrocladus abbreviatus]
MPTRNPPLGALCCLPLPSPSRPLLHTNPHKSISQQKKKRTKKEKKKPTMLLAIFLALFLPCAGMSVVFVVYMCLLWYSAASSGEGNGQHEFNPPAKPVAEKGLTAAELEKLPKVSGKGLVLGTDCAVCLEEIEIEQPARLIPGCNHGFHLECADTWLSKHSACPVCRAKLGPEFFDASLPDPC